MQMSRIAVRVQIPVETLETCKLRSKAWWTKSYGLSDGLG